MMNPKEVYDKVASLEDRIRHLESERKQLIEALVGLIRLEHIIINPVVNKEHEGESQALCEMMDKAKTALRDAGEDS